MDASVTLTYLLTEEAQSEPAARAFEVLEKTGAHVPSIWASEVANALVVKERKNLISDSVVNRVLRILDSLPVRIDEDGDVLGATTVLARRHQRSVYDAQYLELALRLGVPLATFDGGLKQGAVEAGVQLAQF